MEVQVEILASSSGTLRIFKRHPGWRRGLAVRVVQDGRRREVLFPAPDLELTVDGLRPDLACTVAVGADNPLKRWFRGRETYPVELPPRGLTAVVTGSGRCGTLSLARYLDGRRRLDGTVIAARHETLSDYLLEPIARHDRARVEPILRGLRHDIECAPPLSLVPEIVADRALVPRLVHLVRDGRRVVQSGLNRGWYQNDAPWNRVKPDFPGDAFEKSCRFWAHTNENLDAIAGLRVRLEDLAAEDDAPRRRLLEHLGLEPDATPVPRENRGHVPSRTDGWTTAQQETFARICGDLMDRYYPGWR